MMQAYWQAQLQVEKLKTKVHSASPRRQKPLRAQLAEEERKLVSLSYVEYR